MSVEQLQEAQKIATIVSVQNLYNLAKRDAEPLLEHSEQHGIAFIPWFPLATGGPAEGGRQARPARQEALGDALAARAGLAAAPPRR